MRIGDHVRVHIGAQMVFAVMLLWAALPTLTEAAALGISPNTGVYTVGSPVTVRVTLNTQGAPVNAAEGTLSFNPKLMRVDSVSTAGSIFNLWTIDPTFSNGAGTITFGGGSPRGYTGSAGTIVSVRFTPLSGGTAELSFTSGSALAADGQGTNVLQSMGSGSFTIAAQSSTPEPEVIEYVAPANTPAAPVITSSTHSDPDGWYTDTTATLSWSVPAGVSAVRTGLTSSPGNVPTVVYDDPISSRTLEDLEQGEQWFHLQFQNENGWGRVTHYRLAVDSEKPESFDISLAADSDAGNPEPQLFFDVEDATSPVERFIIQINGGEAIEWIDETGSSTYQLPRLNPGRHSVVVEAFDAAGNSIVNTYAFDIASFERPVFTDYPSSLNTGVVPVISGSTRPSSEVTITIERIDGSTIPEMYTVVSNEDGGFTLIPDRSFAEGVYELTALATDAHGAQSEPSQPVRIVVSPPGFVVIGSLLVSALSIFVPLVALVLLLILGTLYLTGRIRSVASYVRRETAEAEGVIATTFARLQRILDTHTTALTESRKTKKLTQAEAELIETLRKELREAERRVSKEVSDVDDIVT